MPTTEPSCRMRACCAGTLHKLLRIVKYRRCSPCHVLQALCEASCSRGFS